MSINKLRKSSGSEANWVASGNPEAKVLDGFGVYGGGDHTTNEFFYKKSFQESLDLTYNVVRRILSS